MMTAPAPQSPTWDDVLDEFERRIASGEASLESGEPFEPFVLEPFVPPPGLEPLPEHLTDRAIALLQLNTDLKTRMQTAVETLAREIKSTSTGKKTGSRFAETSVPKYFDESV